MARNRTIFISNMIFHQSLALWLQYMKLQNLKTVVDYFVYYELVQWVNYVNNGFHLLIEGYGQAKWKINCSKINMKNLLYFYLFIFYCMCEVCGSGGTLPYMYRTVSGAAPEPEDVSP